MSNHYSEEELTLHFYGEHSDATAIDEHMADCEGCREEYAALNRLFGAVDTVTVPERDAAYGRRVWRHVESRLSEAKPTFWQSLFGTKQLVLAGSVAALIIVAFVSGKEIGFTSGQETALTEEVRQRMLMLAVSEHLETTGTMLTELRNAEGNGGFDLTEQQQRADLLTSANRTYRRTAGQRGEDQIVDLLEQLEQVLLDIANSPTRLSAPEFNALWRRVESGGLLIKMRAVETETRARRLKNSNNET